MTRLRPALAVVVVCIAVVAAACSSSESSSAGDRVTRDTDASGVVAADGATTTSAPGADVCSGPNGVGGPVPAGAGPGDLVAASPVPSTDPSGATSPGFPTGAAVQRMLYVSTASDETDLTLVCGTATIPVKGPKPADGRTRVLAWAHGTQGLEQRCLPSNDPAAYLWGPMAAGIQTVAWGSLTSKRSGTPDNGKLQYAVDNGWIVAAADYQPVDTYVIGRVAAANVLDSVRAALQLAAREFPETADTPADVVVSGHSQGGHAALWAGQMADPYLAATGTPAGRIRLRGVEALAPAANFVVQPDRQPGTQFGDGLADKEMHQPLALLPIPIAAAELQIGPALFSYIFGSWSQFSAGRAPAAGSATPAGPPTGPLDLAKVATDEGAATIRTVQPLCLDKKDATKVKAAVDPYRDAATNQMLVPSLWNLPPSGYRTGQYFPGGTDRTCATESATLGGWCEWIRWNMPGPLGANPFPKVPTSGGSPVPLLIAQGTNDTVIHCVAPGGGPTNQIAPGPDCTSTALYESLLPDYCPGGGSGTPLLLRQFRKAANSPADHFSIPGQIAAKKLSTSASDLVYTGSPSQQFVQGAFDGTLPAACSTAVLNP